LVDWGLGDGFHVVLFHGPECTHAPDDVSRDLEDGSR
jgi:hypothetical protein